MILDSTLPVVTDGWLFTLVQFARVLTVIAGASCAARLILVRKRPVHQYPPARQAGIQALLAFACSLPLFSLISLLSQGPVGLPSMVHPALLYCFWMTHRYLTKAETEEPSEDSPRRA